MGSERRRRFHGFLDKREPREAGFTEQRPPLAPDSGGITGCCTSNPQKPSEPYAMNHHFFSCSRAFGMKAGYSIRKTEKRQRVAIDLKLFCASYGFGKESMA
ncbi:hypothetical protein VNO77_29782 [Canavalia gladiata]|uniref:Uncharacterized protein n=1 Tax=Canavalia gladiata TaxID=3824 RepID=A0AAN9KQE7_CANGL